MTKAPLTSEELTRLTTGLNKLARNLWWTWDQEAQEVFSELSPRGWQNLYHNAVAILHEVSDYELRVRLQDPDFAERVRRLLQAFDSYLNEKKDRKSTRLNSSHLVISYAVFCLKQK